MSDLKVAMKSESGPSSAFKCAIVISEREDDGKEHEPTFPLVPVALVSASVNVAVYLDMSQCCLSLYWVCRTSRTVSSSATSLVAGGWTAPTSSKRTDINCTRSCTFQTTVLESR